MCLEEWHERHEEHYKPNYAALKKQAISQFSSALTEDDLLNITTVSVIASALVDRVEQMSEGELSRSPHFSCPLPCEYRFGLWRNLFIASIILNVSLIFAVVPFIRSVIVHDNKEPLIT
ncbi:unnamed protein product [Anisakis simplex]|uniref:CNNM transmembrane domain-containing protein n=1 Tax=Anisakis simplex TaxID=6269 RepID=A0A0M3J1C1_ANISI|nr:unnamed protein product [Anisakis simplex]